MQWKETSIEETTGIKWFKMLYKRYIKIRKCDLRVSTQTQGSQVKNIYKMYDYKVTVGKSS